MSIAVELPRATGIVLAGGKSERMGQNKALIQFRGKPLIQHALERISPLCSEVYIVANDPTLYAEFHAPVLQDIIPGQGSLGGIYTGLVRSRDQFVLAVACDMPFLNPDLLGYELSLASQADVIVPRAKNLSGKTPHSKKRPNAEGKLLAKMSDLHPLHAVYSKTCLAVMREMIEAGDLRVISFFDRVNIRIVEQDEVDRFDPLHISVFNTNTAQDMQAAEGLIVDAESKS
jgi:molybdopterin-guanine dinucleotide biosynthesis protein A